MWGLHRHKGTLKDFLIEINGSNRFFLDTGTPQVNVFLFSFFPSDVDECAAFDLNSCDQICNNTDGGYVCSCVDGYNLDADNFTCNGKLQLQEACYAIL